MKKFIFILMLFTFITVLPFSTAASEVGNDTLDILKELSIMEGDENGNFELERNVTRAEFTKMAVKASKFRNSVALNLSISPYKDVTFKMWYAPYVKTASLSELVKGYSDGSFRPDSTVLYEEAVTVLLRLLGYTDEDFGVSWPYGQMGIAESTGMCKGINCFVGQVMNRGDIAELFGNFLRTYSKGTSTEYINTLDYSFLEDVILIATSNEDSSVGSDKILTSEGTFKINKWFDYDCVGKKGDVLIKNGEELILFYADNQIVNEYVIYQVLSDKIVVMEENGLEQLDIDKNLVVYSKSSKTDINALYNTLSAGDAITTFSNENGVLDYGIVKVDEMKGPYTVTSGSWMQDYGYVNPAINKNGVKTDASSIEINDIIYYSEKLNTVWAYSDKITGIYEKASPNKDNPDTIQVSGMTYNIDGVAALKKLSTGGEYAYGDTVTLLLGKDGGIADVKMQTDSSDFVYGYLSETGTKTFTDTSGSYSSYYATIVKADGETATYAVKSNYETIKNKVVKVTFSGKYANMSAVTGSSSVSGTASLSSRTIGSTPLAENVKILEVSTTDASENGVYSSVYMPRLDGVNLKSSQIIFAGKNAKGAVEELFICDVTGDLNKYGIITEAPSSKETGGTYKIDIAGSEVSVSNSKSFSVVKWQPCKAVYSGNTVDSLTPLKKISSYVKNLTETLCTADNTKYLLSDTAVGYVRKSDYTYMMISLNDLIEDQDSYNIYAYYDNSASNGGRIRILTAIPK